MSVGRSAKCREMKEVRTVEFENEKEKINTYDGHLLIVIAKCSKMKEV